MITNVILKLANYGHPNSMLFDLGRVKRDIRKALRNLNPSCAGEYFIEHLFNCLKSP